MRWKLAQGHLGSCVARMADRLAPMVDPLSVIAGAVLGGVSGEALKYAAAPLEARRMHRLETIKARLERAQVAADHQNRGRTTQPSDRVAFKALTEAALTDDELVADYLGGVVAASGPDDDAGVPAVALIGRLSALQLRFHYVIYRAARDLVTRDGSVNLYQASSAPWLRVSRMSLATALEDINVGLVVSSTLYSLAREGLIGSQWSYGGLAESLDSVAQIRVSAPGAELFLAGHGYPYVASANTLFSPDIELEMLSEVPRCDGVEVAASMSRTSSPVPDRAGPANPSS